MLPLRQLRLRLLQRFNLAAFPQGPQLQRLPLRLPLGRVRCLRIRQDLQSHRDPVRRERVPLLPHQHPSAQPLQPPRQLRALQGLPVLPPVPVGLVVPVVNDILFVPAPDLASLVPALPLACAQPLRPAKHVPACRLLVRARRRRVFRNVPEALVRGVAPVVQGPAVRVSPACRRLSPESRSTRGSLPSAQRAAARSWKNGSPKASESFTPCERAPV